MKKFTLIMVLFMFLLPTVVMAGPSPHKCKVGHTLQQKGPVMISHYKMRCSSPMVPVGPTTPLYNPPIYFQPPMYNYGPPYWGPPIPPPFPPCLFIVRSVVTLPFRILGGVADALW